MDFLASKSEPSMAAIAAAYCSQCSAKFLIWSDDPPELLAAAGVRADS